MSDYEDDDDEEAQLIEEAIRMDVDDLDILLSKDPTWVNNVISKNEGMSLLMIFAEEGQEEKVRVLLERYNASCDLRSFDNNASILHFASRGGNGKIVEMILKRNKHLVHSKTNEGDTPLIWSALEGNLECSKVLLQHNADPFVMNQDKATPLICAAMLHRESSGNSTGVDTERAFLVKALLDAAIATGNIDEYINRQDVEGSTALMLASYGGNGNCVKVLLNYHADITKRNNRGETALEEAQQGYTVNPHHDGYKQVIGYLKEAWVRLEEEASRTASALLEEDWIDDSGIKNKKNNGSSNKKKKQTKKKGKANKGIDNGKKIMEPIEHYGIQCDRCASLLSNSEESKNIIGDRLKCNECLDYDLCSTCFINVKAIHDSSHTFQVISLNANNKNTNALINSVVAKPKEVSVASSEISDSSSGEEAAIVDGSWTHTKKKPTKDIFVSDKSKDVVDNRKVVELNKVNVSAPYFVVKEGKQRIVKDEKKEVEKKEEKREINKKDIKVEKREEKKEEEKKVDTKVSPILTQEAIIPKQPSIDLEMENSNNTVVNSLSSLLDDSISGIGENISKTKTDNVTPTFHSSSFLFSSGSVESNVISSTIIPNLSPSDLNSMFMPPPGFEFRQKSKVESNNSWANGPDLTRGFSAIRSKYTANKPNLWTKSEPPVSSSFGTNAFSSYSSPPPPFSEKPSSLWANDSNLNSLDSLSSSSTKMMNSMPENNKSATSSNSGSPKGKESLQKELESRHASASRDGIKVAHLFGLNISELNYTQLASLEDILDDTIRKVRKEKIEALSRFEYSRGYSDCLKESRIKNILNP